MSSFNVFQIAKEMNGPPGIVHPLLVENYDLVDERLCEMYNGYALTSSNCDEYEAAGLLKENWDWVDRRLEEMCNPKEEKHPFPLCPLPITWGYPRPCDRLESIEDDNDSMESYIGHKRKRSESDISDYEEEAGRTIKRLRCQSPIPTGKYIQLFSNPFCNLDCERYNELATAMVYDDESVGSFEFGSTCGEFNSFIDSIASLSVRAPSCVNVVTDDEESVYYDTDYDCDGYDSP
jgi:hypothetical protein